MKIVYFLAVATFFSMASLSMLLTVEALYLGSLGNDTFLIGVAIGAPGLAILLFSPVIGKLSDDFGRKKIIVFFTMLLPLIPILLIFSGSIQNYIAIKFLAGILACGDFLMLSVLGDLLENKKKAGFLFGIYIMGPSLGSSFGSLISGSVASLFGSLTIPYFISSAMFLLAFIFVLPLLKHREERGNEKLWEFPKISIKIPLLAILAMTFILGFHMSMKNLLWPIIVKEFSPQNLAPFFTGLIFAFMGMAAGILSPIAGRMSDRHSPKSIFFLGWFVAGFFALILSFSPGILIFGILSVSYATGEALKGPSSSVFASRLSKRSNRGLVFGLMASVGSLAYFSGPIISGFMLNYFSWRILLLIYGIAILIPFLIFFYLMKNEEI